MRWLWLIPLAAVAQPPPPAAIAKLAAQAAQARDADRPADALKLYEQAVRTAPQWAEGWWQIGTIHYAQDRYPACRDAFRTFTGLNAQVSAGFGFLGLCEFQTRDFAASVGHLERAAALGLPAGEQLADVVLFHLVLLHTKGGNFERALQFGEMLAKRASASPNPNLAGVMGIAALRRPLFPHELPEADRDLATRLGNTLLAAGSAPAGETIAQFEEIIRLYPKTPNLHYTYATFLMLNKPDQGIEELKKEVELSPRHVPALVSLAIELLRRNDVEQARHYAAQAAQQAPRNFAARATYGRVLVEAGDPAGAIRELEAAVKLAPDSPQVHFSLAGAYAKAGRNADAARERAEFARLKKLTESP